MSNTLSTRTEYPEFSSIYLSKTLSPHQFEKELITSCGVMLMKYLHVAMLQYLYWNRVQDLGNKHEDFLNVGLKTVNDLSNFQSIIYFNTKCTVFCTVSQSDQVTIETE